MEEATICKNEKAFCIRVICVKKTHTQKLLGHVWVKIPHEDKYYAGPDASKMPLKLLTAALITAATVNAAKASEDYPSTRTVTADSLQLKACHFRV